MVENYKELRVWQKGFEVAAEIFALCESFPKSQQYGLVSQMQRAATSIISNIAEGYHRRSRREYVQFLSISLGSAAELETQVLLSRKISYIPQDKACNILSEIEQIAKMLRSMIQKLS